MVGKKKRDQREGQETTIGRMLSQLEELKWRSLFRTLVDGSYGPSRSTSYPTPNSYVFAHYRPIGAELMATGALMYVVGYLPPELHQPEIVPTFFKTEYHKALADLRSYHLFPFSGVPRKADVFNVYFVSNVGNSTFLDGVIGSDPAAYVAAEDIYKEFATDQLPGCAFREFGIGSPETIAHNDPEVVQQELITLLNTPSDLSILIREGQLKFIPTVHHGLFYASERAHEHIREVERGASLSSCSVMTSLGGLSERLSQFELLLKSSTKEADLQAFFEEYPEFLLTLDHRYSEIRPHVCLIDKNSNQLIPDFLARIEDSNVWDIIELKRPEARVNRQKKPLTPAAAAASGIKQLLQYRDYFDSSDNRRRFASRYGAHGYDPALVLVLGRGHNTYEWSTVKAHYPKVRIVPYDFILERAKSCRTLLSELTKQQSARKSP